MRQPAPRVVVTFVVLTLSIASCAQPTAQGLRPRLGTSPVGDDADDPAIWINKTDPAKSLIVSTNKIASPDGALYVFDLGGVVRQVITPLDRPNNVDVEYDFATPGGPIDIAVASERLQGRLRVYRVSEQGLTAIDGGGIPVLEGQTDEAAMPMGVALYRRPADGAVFAVVAPKTGGATNYLWQYRLEFDAAAGVVRGTLVRRFGNFSGHGEIEAVAVDDALGYVYYADEEYALRKWAADPDSTEATRELAVFGTAGFDMQREGIAIVANSDGTGFIVCSDQIPGGSVLRVFPREGQPGNPHAHDPALAAIQTQADSTDGIDATPQALGPGFPEGLLVMMNSNGRNFQFYNLADLMTSIAHSTAQTGAQPGAMARRPAP